MSLKVNYFQQKIKKNKYRLGVVSINHNKWT